MEKKSVDTIDTVDNVIRFIHSHRDQAVSGLFHTAIEAFKEQWRKKSDYDFWISLRNDEKLDLMYMVHIHYE